MVAESLGPRAQQLHALVRTFNEDNNSAMQAVPLSPARSTPATVASARGSTPTPRRSLSRTLCRPDFETDGSPINLEHEIDASVMVSCAEMEQDEESLDVNTVSVRARSLSMLKSRCLRSSGCWLRAMQLATRRTGLNAKLEDDSEMPMPQVQVVMTRAFGIFLANRRDSDLNLKPMELFGFNTGTYAEKGKGLVWR